jgi:hypothetical protein
MRMLPSANPSRYQHQDPSVVTTCTHSRCRNVRCPRGRVRRPRWTPRLDRLPDTACPVVSGRTPSTPPGTPWRTGSDADRERTARKALGHPRSPRPQGGPPGHAEPPPVGPVFAVWQPRLARRWQDCQRDRNHGCDQAATWCRSTVQAAPRRTALLRRIGMRVLRKVMRQRRVRQSW